MRTTVSIPEPLLREAKVLAAKSGSSLSKVVEKGLRAVIEQQVASMDDRRPPLVISKHGGLKPGINLDKIGELMALMDVWDETDRRKRADLRQP
jgi:hypothetical protein